MSDENTNTNTPRVPRWADPRRLTTPRPCTRGRARTPGRGSRRPGFGRRSRPRRPPLSVTATRQRRTPAAAGGTHGGTPGRLPGSAALLTVDRRAGKRTVRPASIARRLLPPPRAKSERRGSRRGSEGKGLAPSSLRGGYVAILDPRDKKIHARENWWAVLPVTRPLSDSSI